MNSKEIENIKEPLVSIIVPTYNSSAYLHRCMESIKGQTYKNIELILVDKGSTDNTIEIAREYNADIYAIEATERCEQLNYGINKAKGKYIYRVDCDFVLDPDITEEAVIKCENEAYDAICIHNTSDPNISFWSKVRKLERDCYIDDNINVAARFIKMDVIKKVGGFNEDLVASEDYDLHNRILKNSFNIGRISSKEVHIGEPKTILEVARKHYYYGKTISNFMKYNSNRGLKQLSPFRFAYIRHISNFAEDPLLTLGFLVYQLIRYSSAALGYLVERLKI